MPQITDPSSNNNSEYNQASFIGGMNLLLDDTHLPTNQYRIGFNVRNRFDRLDPIPSSQLDGNFPPGVVQEVITFGNYQIAFIQGFAYYKLYTDFIWHQIANFRMDENAPRYWTCAVPVATTNYLRIAATVQNITGSVQPDAYGGINLQSVSGAFAGNLPGLVVQDNINQPQFLFLGVGPDGVTLIPLCRTTQAFADWSISFSDVDNTIISVNGDKREYVPIGNFMAYIDGILYIASQDGNNIYRSVSGRPLDFVVNVKNTLATAGPPYVVTPGGDATTTSYSVGVGPITCLRPLSDGSLFVAAANACFRVSKNMSNIAPKIFGEWTFVRDFLFNSTVLSDRVIFDTDGDTRFISLNGVRSFNAIIQMQNEGRNSLFTKNVAPLFNGIIQNAQTSAGILYDNYELYAVNTIFGPAILVYDTVPGCWVGLDLAQTGGKLIKQFAKIELTTQALFAVTEDNKLYRLYSSPDGIDIASFRTAGICSSIFYGGENVKLADPRIEIKPNKVRIIQNLITKDCTISILPYVNNRIAGDLQIKYVEYDAPTNPDHSILSLDDVDTMMRNHLFSLPDNRQGWKVFIVISWTNGSITQFSVEMLDQNPMNPLRSQT
jgi:hypothetical protein